jgi:hypothetical protein
VCVGIIKKVVGQEEHSPLPLLLNPERRKKLLLRFRSIEGFSSPAMSRLKLKTTEEDETGVLPGSREAVVDLRAGDPSIRQLSTARYYITLLGIQNVVVWAGGDVVCVDYLYLRVPDDAAKDVAIGHTGSG